MTDPARTALEALREPLTKAVAWFETHRQRYGTTGWELLAERSQREHLNTLREVLRIALASVPSAPVEAPARTALKAVRKLHRYWIKPDGLSNRREFVAWDELEAALAAALPGEPLSESIWCDGCGEVQPLVRAYMPADQNNDHSATDLLCGECRFVIATLHHLDVKGKGRE